MTRSSDPRRDLWRRLPPEEAARLARELLANRGLAGRARGPWRLVLVGLVLIGIATVAVIYLHAWMLALGA